MAESNLSEAIERLVELQRRAAHEATTDAERELSRQRFLERLPSRPAAATGWSGARWAIPLAALAAVALIWLMFFRAPALTFEVVGAELSGRYVRAPAQGPAELRFSDRSNVKIAAGSRLRVEEASPRGAQVWLERGQVSVAVRHADSTAWTFAAGPFEVRVTGTRFDLTWDPSREICEIALHEGSVAVAGPTGSGPVVLRAGQRFRGDAQRRTMQVLELSSREPPPQPDSEALPTADPATPETAPAPTEPAGSAPGPVERPARTDERPPSWAERITRGQFKEIVSDAEARGIPACLSSCSASDLRALSDAARYTGNAALAEKALMALRQRFAGARASEAAFLLGRLEEKRGATSAAERWYGTYLQEAPSGSFAAEALAGKLRVVRAARGKAAAEPLAREYLRRFPNGVHVSTAREILGEK